MKLTGAQALIKSLEIEARRGHVRPARRLHPAGLRPHPRLADPPHPGPPRAGRRPHGRGLRPRHRPARRGHGDQRPGGHQPGHARCATPTWTRSRWWPSPARSAGRSIGTDGFQECDTVGITRSVTKHNELIMDPDDIPLHRPPGVPPGHHRAARAGAPRRAQGRAAGRGRLDWPTDADVAASLPGYKPNLNGPSPHDQGSRPPDRRGRRPVIYAGGGILKARAAEALRALAELHRHPRGHHPDGPRRLPRRPSRSAWACPACTATTRPSRPCRRPTC